MSLFGTYIQEAKVAAEPIDEAVLAIDEAAIFDFDYFGEAFQETIDECTNFENAIGSVFVETVITEGFGEKAKAAIKKAIEKLGNIIADIIKKIKGFINNLRNVRKQTEDDVKFIATEAPKLLEAKENTASKTSKEDVKNKAEEICKGTKFYILSHEFKSDVRNFEDPSKLSFYYGYGDKGQTLAKKDDPDRDVNNRLAGASDRLTSNMNNEELCIKVLEANNVTEAIKNSKAAAAELAGYEEISKRLLAYSNAAEAAKKKMEIACNKWSSIEYNPKSNEQGATASYATTVIWKDIQVVTKYITNIGKATAHIDHVIERNAKSAKRLAFAFKKFTGKEVAA